jgi:hypothetical protein
MNKENIILLDDYKKQKIEEDRVRFDNLNKIREENQSPFNKFYNDVDNLLKLQMQMLNI